MHLTRKLAITGLAGLLTVVAAACSSQGGAQVQAPAQGGAAGGPSFTIAMVTHEAPGNVFFDRVRAGAEQAAKEHGITLKYSNDGEANQQATLIQNAVDSKVDGIAVTLPNPDVLGPSLAKATAAGIPATVFNAGIDAYTKYGALAYFGSDENLAGQQAGQRLAQAVGNSGKIICVVQAAGVTTLETRCNGVRKSFPNTENLQVNGADLPSVQQVVQAKLAQDPSITGIVTLDAGSAGAAVQAEAAAGSKAKIITFDLSQDVVTAIQKGQIAFSVDQQPYLQGYEAIDALWLQLTNGNVLGGGGPVLTGPAFVDSSNIESVSRFAANNTR